MFQEGIVRIEGTEYVVQPRIVLSIILTIFSIFPQLNKIKLTHNCSFLGQKAYVMILLQQEVGKTAVKSTKLSSCSVLAVD